MDYKSTRVAFGDAICEIARSNKNIYALTADLTDSIKLTKFKELFPDRFIQMGISEQNMAGVASGLAFEGKIPFITSFAVFSPGRNWDQIRVSICYSKANVKIIGGHTGLTNNGDGATHMGLEDIAITRVLPNMTIFSPADANQTRQAVFEAVKINGPVYIRIARNDWPIFINTEFEVGKSEFLTRGDDITIVATGQMVYRTLEVVKTLSHDHNIHADLINISTIKPIDTAEIQNSIAKTKKLVVVEEHQVHGGLASAILENFRHFSNFEFLHIGIADTFAESGDIKKLYEKYGLSNEKLLFNILNFYKNENKS